MKFHPSLTTCSRFVGAVLLAAAATLPARADYPTTVISQGPVGYWQLNETTQPPANTAAVNLGSLGSSANGTFNNFPLRGLPGPFSGSVAVQVDGSQSITTPYQAALNPSPFSVEFWANPASASVPGGLLCVASSMYSSAPRAGWLVYQSDASGGGVGYMFRLYATNGTAFSISLFTPANTTPGVWTHLVFTFDGSTARSYTNGVLANSGVPTGAGFVVNPSAQFAIGTRSDGGFSWPGQVSEVACYASALTGTQVANHHTTAIGTPANYGNVVLGDAPILYWRLNTPADPSAANSGTLGSAANGLYIYDARPGVSGPRPATFPGFGAGNDAVAFDAGSGVVRIPNLNLNTNTVTICGWVNPTGAQAIATGLITCNGGSTAVGLTIDQQFAGLGLGASWGGNNWGWSPQNDSGLPALVDSQWNFVSMVIQPDSVTLYICDRNYLDFASASLKAPTVANGVQAFDAPTLIGTQAGGNSFNGAIDEVAIFNRALSQGEVYTEYATAVGGVPPQIFTDLQGPATPVAVGDPIILTIDGGGSTPLTYTWHKNGSTIATTSSGTYTIPSAAFTDAGNYDVTISNGVGSPAQSQMVSVSVISPSAPTITASSGFQNRTLYPGGTLNLSVTALGGGLKYIWYKNSTAIAGASTSAYAIASVANTDAGNYSVSVTNTLGVASNGPVAIAVNVPSSGSYEAAVVASAPVSWWRLGEPPGATNMFDSMGRHDGYYSNVNNTVPPVGLGAPGAINGDPDTAASFTMNGGLGVVPFFGALNGADFSIEVWAKTSDLSDPIVPSSSSYAGNGVWFQPSGGWWYLQTPGSGGGFGNNGNANGGAQVVPGQWTHLVVTYNYNQIIGGNRYPFAFYANGATDGYVWSAGNNLANAAGPFIVGARGVSAATLADSFFNGNVDEVAVYNRVLTGTEILAHFNGRFGNTTPPYFVGSFTPQTVTPGKNLSYSTTVFGSLPITLQWYKNSSPIAGATTAALALNNVQVTDTATYTLWATNVAGTASQSVNVTVIPPVPYANVTNGLVLHLKMDGNTLDSSGRGNNGTAVGGPTFVTGQIAQGLNTVTTVVTNNGTNLVVNTASYVNIGAVADLQFGASTSWSASMWVKLAAGSMPVDIPFIGTATNSNYSPGWDISPGYENGGYQWNLNDGVNNINVSSAGGELNNGLWHHYALVIDRAGHTASTYLDGVMVIAKDISGLGSVDNGGFVTIAQDPTGAYNGASSPFTAADAAAFPSSISLDDIGVWRRALSATEVAKIQSAGVNGPHSFDQPAPPVTITVTRSGGNVTLNWAVGTLLQSTSLGAGASWVPVTGAAAPSYTFTPTGTTKFFRVITQ